MITSVKFVATDVYHDIKQTVLIQLSSVTRRTLDDLSTSCFIKGPLLLDHIGLKV